MRKLVKYLIMETFVRALLHIDTKDIQRKGSFPKQLGEAVSVLLAGSFLG